MSNPTKWQVALALGGLVALLAVMGVAVLPTSSADDIQAGRPRQRPIEPGVTANSRPVSAAQFARLFDGEPIVGRPARPVLPKSSPAAVRPTIEPRPSPPAVTLTLAFLGYVEVTNRGRHYYFKDTSRNRTINLLVGQSKDGWTLVADRDQLLVLEKSGVRFELRQK